MVETDHISNVAFHEFVEADWRQLAKQRRSWVLHFLELFNTEGLIIAGKYLKKDIIHKTFLHSTVVKMFNDDQDMMTLSTFHHLSMKTYTTNCEIAINLSYINFYISFFLSTSFLKAKNMSVEGNPTDPVFCKHTIIFRMKHFFNTLISL